MTKRKTAITVDPAKVDRAIALLGITNFSEVVDRALDLLIREEQGRRDLEAYERQPLTPEELWTTSPALGGDPTDDTDWAALYADVAE